MEGTAYAAGTVLNALATGVGSAFAIDLRTSVRLREGDSEGRNVKVIVNGVERKSNIAQRILRQAGFQGVVVVESEIPGGCGLGSSSAFVNALLLAVRKYMGYDLDAGEILRTNARLSVEAGISYTGAFDDASASLLGGFVVSENYRMRLYRRDELEGYAAVLIPKFGRVEVDWGKIRAEAAKLSSAVEAAKSGEYCRAMMENTKYYCGVMGYPTRIAEKGWTLGICCGLSGNGPSYVAFGSRNEMKAISNLWEDYGSVVVKKLVTDPAEKVIISDGLFIDPS